MCLEYECCYCQRIKYHRCDDARKPENHEGDPRKCRNARREMSQRRQCALCRSLAEVSDRLRRWIISQAADRLMTDGGAAEEASSPPAAEDHSAHLVQQQRQGADQQVYHQDNKDPVERAGSEGFTAGTTPRPVANDDAQDPEARSINLEHPNRRDRPLSGSTMGCSSTAPTALGSSSVTYKRESGGKPQEAYASQAGFEVQTLAQADQARHVNNPSKGYYTSAAATTLGCLSNENTPMAPANTVQAGGPTTQSTSDFRHPILPLSAIDRPAEASGSLPLSTGALKRTISSPTFGDLTPQTRTACPPSEATNVPPAYARPRNEVGLPPLPLRASQNKEAEDIDDDEKETAQRGRLRPRPRPRSASGSGSRERSASAQEYLTYARDEFRRFG